MAMYSIENAFLGSVLDHETPKRHRLGEMYDSVAVDGKGKIFLSGQKGIAVFDRNLRNLYTIRNANCENAEMEFESGDDEGDDDDDGGGTYDLPFKHGFSALAVAPNDELYAVAERRRYGLEDRGTEIQVCGSVACF